MSANSTPTLVAGPAPKPVGVSLDPPCDKCKTANRDCTMTPDEDVQPQNQRPRTACDRCHKRKERCPRPGPPRVQAPAQPPPVVAPAPVWAGPNAGATMFGLDGRLENGEDAMEVDLQEEESDLPPGPDDQEEAEADWAAKWVVNNDDFDDDLRGFGEVTLEGPDDLPALYYSDVPVQRWERSRRTGQGLMAVPRRGAQRFRRFQNLDDPDEHVDEQRRREDPEFDAYANLLTMCAFAPKPSASGEGYDWAYSGPSLPAHPPSVFEVPAEFFYVHNLYTHPWHFDKPGALRTESAKQQPDPVYPDNTGMRYFYWRKADDDAQNMETTRDRIHVAEEYQFKHYGYLGTVRPILPVSSPKPDGPMGEHFLAVRWVNWFELHADIVLLKGRYKVEFMFKIIPQTSLSDFYIKINGTLTDTWDLPHEKPNEPLRAIHGINLRAGFPETWENFTTSSICETLSKVGHMRDPANSTVEVRQAARRCISEDDYETDVWKAWEMDDGGMKLPVQRGAAERPEDVGILEVLRDGTHVRLLAFQGTNKRHSGRGNPPRGRFLFGGVRLTRVGD